MTSWESRSLPAARSENVNRTNGTAAPRAAPVYWGTFCTFSLLYLLTCQRGVSWQDSGWFQWRVLVGEYDHPVGLALAHPLYIAAGRLLLKVPIASFTSRLNFFSGLGMALTLANLSAVVALLTGRVWAGFAAALMLGVAHTCWWLSTLAEVYTWSAAGLSAELWLLVKLLKRPRWSTLAGLALVNGIGFSVHNVALLSLPVYVIAAILLVVRRRLTPFSLVLGLGAYLLGAGPMIAMIVSEALASADAARVVQRAFFGSYVSTVLSFRLVGPYTKINVGLASLNFGSLLGPLALVGAVRARRRLGGPLALAIGAIALIEMLFVSRYHVPDQFTFLLPTMLMIALFAGVGVAVLADESPRRRRTAVIAVAISVLLPPTAYSLSPWLLQVAGVDVYRARQLPYRDEARYWLVPWKQNEDSAERFATEALQQAAPNGMIAADLTSLFPLLLVQRRDDLGSDVSVMLHSTLDHLWTRDQVSTRATLNSRPVYVVSPLKGHAPACLLDHASFGREGVLYRATMKSR